MNAAVVISGSGGQGVLLVGRFLAEAGLLEGREVVWLPYYGAEKRGGTVWCSVIISSEKIGSLFVTRPDAGIAMNLASLRRIEPIMKPGGLLVVNQSIVSSKSNRHDIRTVCVPAYNLANEIGDDSVANLVTLGVLVAGLPVVSRPSVTAVIESMFAKKNEHLEINKRAFDKGYSWVR